MKLKEFRFSTLGDSALILQFGNVIDDKINERVLAFSDQFRAASIVGIKDIVPAYSSIAVYYDVVLLMKKHNGKSPFITITEQLKSLLLKPEKFIVENFRKIEIPVCYAEKYGWDIGEVASHAKLPVEEVVRIHTSGRYKVYMVGFLPGFAYMGEVDDRIAIPRKANPRIHVEAGCVGLAGKQTGIYPLTSPGGWQIIGRTPLKLFDKDKTDPVLLRAGDHVEFFSITEDEFKNY